MIVNVMEALAADRLSLAPVHGAPATGAELYRSPEIARGVRAGVDVLIVLPGKSFPIHTHPGHHVLYVLAGDGTVMIEGETFPSRAGDFVVIAANVLHNVAAGPDGQTILSFGAPHHRIDSHDRMSVSG